MASLRDLSYAPPATGASLRDLTLQQLSADEAAAQAAQYSNPLAAGAKSAIRGTLGGMKGLAAGVVDAYGGNPDELYAAAHHDAELAQAIGPQVRSLRDINDAGDAAAYALGQVGTMAPFLAVGGAGGIGGRLLNRGLGAGLAPGTATHLGATASFVPSMAGEQINQMHELAPDMPADERLTRGLVTGGTQALAGAAIPASLLRGGAPAPFWRGLGKQVLAGGAGMAGMDVAGQANRMDYDPSYQYDPEQTVESAVAGAIGMAPYAVPGALAGRMGQSGVDVAGKARELLGRSDSEPLSLGELGRQALDGVKGAVDSAKDAVSNADLSALGTKLYGETVKGMGDIYGTVETVAKTLASDAGLPEAVRSAAGGAKNPGDVINAFGDLKNWLTKGEKLDGSKLQAVDAAMKRPLQSLQFVDSLVRYLDEVGAEGPKADAVRAQAERLRNGEQLGEREARDFWMQARAAQHAAGDRKALDTVLSIPSKVKITQNGKKVEIENLSRQRDTINLAVRDALKSANADQGLIDRIASRIQTGDVAAGKNLTKVVRDAVAEGMRSFGINPEASIAFTGMYDRVLKAVQERVSALKEEGVIKEDAGQDRPSVSDAFKKAAGDEVRNLFETHERGKDIAPTGEAVAAKAEQVVDFIVRLAEGEEGYTDAAAAKVRAMFDTVFGEQGGAAFDRIVEAAQYEFGGLGDARTENIAALLDTSKTLHQAGASARKLMANKSARLTDLLADIETAKEFDTKRGDYDTKVQKEERKAMAAPFGSDERFEGNARVARMREVGSKTGFEHLKEDWVERGIVTAKNFEKLVQTLESYGRHPDRLTKPERREASHATSANHAAEREMQEEGRSEAPVRREEVENKVRTDGGDEYQQFLADRREESYGVQGNVETPAIFWGTNTRNPGAHKQEDMGAPVSRHPSGDAAREWNAQASEYTNAMEEAHAKYGHRVTEARGATVTDWANELATRTGVAAGRWMNTAMSELLRHDQERLKNDKLTPEDRKWIENRAKLAERVGEDGGEQFFTNPMNRHYRYIRMEQGDASNLKFSAGQLEHGGYTLRRDGKNVEDVGAWVDRQQKKDGGVFSDKDYADSLVPVTRTDGTVMQVDVPKLVADALRRHQAGDITGAGEQGKTDLGKEILTAFHNVVAAIMTGDGMSSDPLGAVAGRDTRTLVNLDPASGRGPVNKKGESTAGDTGVSFDPNLVIFRDPTGRIVQELGEHVEVNSPKRLFRLSDLESIKGVDENLRTIRDRGTAGMFSEADLMRVAPQTKGRSTTVANERAAEVGVAREGAVLDGKNVDIDLHAGLARMIERNGMDASEVLNQGNMPLKMAGMLVREMLLELKTRGYEGPMLAAHESGVFLPDPKFKNVVVYHQRFGDNKSPVTLEQLRQFIQKGEAPRNMRDALLQEAMEKLGRFEEVERKALERIRDKKATTGDMREEGQRLRAAAVDRELNATRFDRGDPETGVYSRKTEDGTTVYDDAAAANKYSLVDTENMRLRSVLKELGQMSSDSTPLFDRITHQLFETNEMAGTAKNREYDRAAAVTKAREELAAYTEEFGGAVPRAEEVSFKDAPAEPLNKPSVPYEQPTIPREVKGNAKMTSTDVKTNQRELEDHAFREESRAVSKRVQEKQRQEEEARAAELQKEVPAEEAPAEAKKEEAPPRTDMKPAIDEWNSRAPKGVAESVRFVDGLKDSELRDFMLGLKPKKGTAAEQAFNRLSADSEWGAKQRERAGVEMTDTGFYDPENPFSRQRTTDNASAQPNAELLQEAKEHFFGDAFKFKLADRLTDKDGNAVSGKFDAKNMEAVVSAMASDRFGTLVHEGWHGVETLLKDMGSHGERILGDIYKHVSSKEVQEWLRERFAGDDGVLGQLGSEKERAAFAFQLIAKGEKIPQLNVESRTALQKVVDFVRSAAAKLGIEFTTTKERAENFLDYLKEGGFARDFENAPALRRALGEKNGDAAAHNIGKALKPLAEGFEKILEHSSERVRKLDIPEYTQVMELLSGPTGKGGFELDRERASIRFANKIGAAIDKMPEAKQKEWFQSMDGYGKVVNEVDRYLRKALEEGGVPADKIEQLAKGLYDKVDSFNAEMIAGNMEEFITDLVQHGGLKGKAGEARQIASEIADRGYFYDPERKLFAGKPAIAEKWLERDPVEKASRFISVATKTAERTRWFGHKDEKLNALLEAGDLKADDAGKQLIRDYIDSVEGKLGGTMSPDMKKLQGSLLFVQNINALPLAVFSQMLEPLQLALRKNAMAGSLDALFRGIKDMPRTFKAIDKKVNPDYWENFAYQVGSAPHRIVNDVMTRLMNGMHLGGAVGKLNERFFRYNFMEQWNRSMHIESTKHAVEFLKESARGQHGEHSERFLKELGLTKDEVLKAIKSENYKGQSYETLHLTDNIERAIVQYVDEAMAHPNTGSNAMWMNDPRFALLAQMKRFTFSHSKYVLDRGMKEAKLGNAFPLAPAVIAMPWMLAADGLRDTLTMAEHNQRANWGAWDYAKHSFERAGHAGRGQFFNDAMNAVGRGSSPVEALGGPTVEMFGNFARGAHNGKLIDAMLDYTPVSALPNI